MNGRYLHLPPATPAAAGPTAGTDPWRGHFFPCPEEMGIDPEAFPAEFGNCACGMTYGEFQRGAEGWCAP